LPAAFSYLEESLAERRIDVVVVGNVGFDTNIYLSSDTVDFTVETNFSKNLDTIGQAGGFSSRGFAQLGKKTAFIGYIGDDRNGRLIRQEFEIDDIDGMGAQGCALGSGDGIRYFKAVDMERPVVDTNGAGDSLAIGFLSSHILDGYSLEEAILRGQIAARYTCSLKASSSNLITIEKLNNYFQDYHH
jgi:sugar/nucleoside kinase (ribokinase family)